MRRALAVGLVGVALALVVPAVAGAGSSPGFRTPGKAAYCSVGGRTQATRHLLCFAPKNGLWIRLNGIGRRDGRAFLTLGHAERYVGARSSRPPVLRFGRSWTPPGARGVKCVSRRSGLTCRHDKGRGFWLGRSGGYRTY